MRRPRPALSLTVLATVAALVAPVAAQAQDDDGGQVRLRAAVADAPPPRPPLELHGSGWGHSVGLSQYGSYAQALSGRDAATILSTYYPGSSVETRSGTGSQPTRVKLFSGITSSTSVTARGGPLYWQVCNPECQPLTDGSDRPIIQPADTTYSIGYVVAPPAPPAEEGAEEPAPEPTGPKEFGLARPGSEPLRISATHVRLKLPDGGTSAIEGAHPMKSSGTALFADGFHDFHSAAATADQPARMTVVHEVSSLERYLRGLAEVPSSWGAKGSAALDAQVIAARTYALRMIAAKSSISKPWEYHLLATPANQVWIPGRHEGVPTGYHWYEAVDRTAGQVAVYSGAPIYTYYSSSHGGRSEAIEDSWAYGSTPVPYLKSVDDPWSVMPEVNGTPVGNSRAAWTQAVGNTDLAKYVGGFDIVTRVVPQARTAGGSPAEILVEGFDAQGQPLARTFTRPSPDRKPIATANFRRDLKTTDGQTLFSQQVRRFGFPPYDDDDGNVHEYAIVFVTTAGIARGTTATEFAPTRAVTRGQMATFLYQMLELPPGQATFPDVPPEHPHAASISAVADAGITQGYADGTFRPNDPVTRAQMATFLAMALELAPGQSDGRFEDVPSGTHQPSIYAVAEAGITTGCDTARYCPLDSVTRGQMASFLHRAVEHARS